MNNAFTVYGIYLTPAGFLHGFWLQDKSGLVFQTLSRGCAEVQLAIVLAKEKNPDNLKAEIKPFDN